MSSICLWKHHSHANFMALTTTAQSQSDKTNRTAFVLSKTVPLLPKGSII
jgi:hypothetical protein